MAKRSKISDKYFDDKGKFLPMLLEKDIVTEYDIIYVDKLEFYGYKKIWEQVSEKALRHSCRKKLGSRYTNGYVDTIIKFVKDGSFVEYDEFTKSSKNKLVLNNGTLDITDWSTPEFFNEEYFKEDYTKIQLKCNYNPEAKCEKFISFLQDIFNGDQEIVDLIGEMFGYCLTNSVKFQEAFLLYGAGANGKSTLLNVLQALVTEDNCCSVNINELSKPFHRASLFNKLVSISSELEGRITNTSYFKQVVAGDIIPAEFKFKDSFQFRPFVKLVYGLNQLPKVNDSSYGFFRRLIIIPFENIYEGTNRDNDLEGKLLNELDGILQFALEGLKRLHKNNKFTISLKVRSIMDEYKKDSDSFRQILEELIEEDEQGETTSSQVYKKYDEYCKNNGFKSFNKSNFGKQLHRALPNVKTDRATIEGKKETIYKGIKLIA